MTNNKNPNDPREMYMKPPMPQQEQELPGLESEMKPLPDYGKGSYKGSGKLEGKAALITGGDSGIGRAIALAYAHEGADVAISYLNEHADAETVAGEIRKTNQKVILLPGDIKDESHCQRMIKQTIGEMGGIDILVNNAAFQIPRKSITEISAKELDDTFKTNIYSMFYLCKAALSHLQPGSSIINTTSIQGYQPSPSLLTYATTKGAIATFTKAFAQEAIRHGIRVNAVAPGPVWTPLIPATSKKEKITTFGQDSLFGRPAQPIELAPLFVFLASQDASYVTGEVYGATGSIGKP